MPGLRKVFRDAMGRVHSLRVLSAAGMVSLTNFKMSVQALKEVKVWGPNVTALRRSVLLNPDGVAIVDERGSMTYRQLAGVPGRPTVLASITTPPGQDAPQGRTTTFGHDTTTGDLLSVTDPLGHVTSYTYNADGTLKTETDARGAGHTTTYPASYDPSGSPNTITDCRSPPFMFLAASDTNRHARSRAARLTLSE